MKKRTFPVASALTSLALMNPLQAQDLSAQSIGEVSVVESRSNAIRFGSNAIRRLSLEEQGGNPDSLVDFIDRSPGVVKSGQNGLFQVFSIRGGSGQRVQTRFAGAPISTERRAGTGASFIDPWFMEHVDVVRGPTSTYFGSGAIGGAVLIAPRFIAGAEAAISYESGSDQRAQSLGLGSKNWSLSLSNRGGNEGESPDSEPLHSGYRQAAILLQNRWESDELSFNGLLLSSRGRDIGRSNSLYPLQRIGEVPEEAHDLVSLSLASKSGWQAQFYAHEQTTLSETLQIDERFNVVKNSTLDWGARVHLTWQQQAFSGEIGADLDRRDNVKAVEMETDFINASQTSRINLDAEESNYALFAMTSVEMTNHRIQFGIRHSWLQQNARLQRRRSETITTGYVGWQWYLAEFWSISGEAATAYRMPSLTERYFTGSTGRGTSIGNADLRSEKAPGVDAGLHWRRGNSSFESHLFRQSFSNYIERTVIDSETRGFANLNKGTISGIEVEGVAGIGNSLSVLYGLHWIEGENSRGEPIADIPATQISLGARYVQERWQLRAYWRHRMNKTRMAVTEQVLDTANVVDLDYRFDLSDHTNITVYVSNALNEAYLISSDEISTLDNERTVGIRFYHAFARSD